MGENTLSSQEFMDKLFTKKDIIRYDQIFGPSWLTPGGEDTVKEFILKLNLQPGDRVLDVGCGAGGSVFYMTKFYGVQVHGVDASKNMIDIARDRLAKEDKEVRDKVHFELGDVTKMNYDKNSYDTIYSLSAITFIAEKEDLFKNFYKWLKPGGNLLIGDICGGNQEQYSETFTRLIKERRYYLMTIESYSKLIESVGFKDLVAIDNRNQWIKALEECLQSFQQTKPAFVKEYGEEDFHFSVKEIEERLEWSRTGEQLWGVFQAKK